MAEYYGYFNGVEYDEEFVALVNSILVQNGVFGNGLIVSAGSGMTVNVAQGGGNCQAKTNQKSHPYKMLSINQAKRMVAFLTGTDHHLCPVLPLHLFLPQTF